MVQEHIALKALNVHFYGHIKNRDHWTKLIWSLTNGRLDLSDDKSWAKIRPLFRSIGKTRATKYQLVVHPTRRFWSDLEKYLQIIPVVGSVISNGAKLQKEIQSRKFYSCGGVLVEAPQDWDWD